VNPKAIKSRVGGMKYLILSKTSDFVIPMKKRKDDTYGGGGGLDILLLLSLLVNFGSPWGNSAFIGARNCIDGRRTSSFKVPGAASSFAAVLRLGNDTEVVASSVAGLDAGEALM
jgi:hypothetical protein